VQPQYTAAPYGQAFRQFLHRLEAPLTKPQWGNLLLLATAFFQKRSLPIRRLARGLAGPTPDCERVDRRLRHFLGSDHLDVAGILEAVLVFLLPRFGAVPFIPVVLDLTFVKQHAILWAQIPYRGRSFPLLVAIYPATKVDPERTFQTQAEQKLLQKLQDQWPSWAPPPLLLADRGFDKPPLLSWLVRHHWLFIIRGKRQARCLDEHGQPISAERQTEPGELRIFRNVRYSTDYFLNLQLVITCAWDPKTAQPSEWRLLTNLPKADLTRAARYYRDRMQPEETHRDCKRGHFVSGFALSHLGRMRADRLERYLFLLGLIYCFLILVAETDRAGRQWFLERHWGLSLITFALDLLQAPGVRLRSLVHQALDCVRLQPLWPENGDC
jgi:hypothetical protein